eukprot:80745-Pleurochrysis_carterae.AAC.2
MVGLHPQLGCERERDGGGLELMMDSATTRWWTPSGEKAGDVEASDEEASDAEAGWHIEWGRSVERCLPSSRVENVRNER